MADCLPDRDGAVREVAQVYELIKAHQPLLLLVHANEQAPSLSTTTLLAQNLLNEALRALNVALSVMKQQQQQLRALNVALSVMKQQQAAAVPASDLKPEPQVLSSSSPADSSGSPAADCKQVSMMRRAAKRRRTEEDKYSWVIMTAVPHEDGYQWRKYGEKKIHGTHFTRSYFRCTYKDDKGCQARKQIQQEDNNDPPMFQVRYNNEHTCNCTSTRAAAKNNLALQVYCNSAAGINYPNGPADHANSRMVKQEPPAALPPVAAEEVTPCQEPFPISNSHCGTSPYDVGIPPTASTNTSAVSCDELEHHHLGQTTAMDHEPALGDDPFFNDPHLLLLYDSFKYY